MPEAVSGALPGWVKGLVAAAVGALIAALVGYLVWFFNIGQDARVTIDGPRTVQMPTIDGQPQPSIFYLTGSVSGGYTEAHWTDTVGYTIPFRENVPLELYCPYPAQFTIRLTATSDNGSRSQQTHDVDCVAG